MKDFILRVMDSVGRSRVSEVKQSWDNGITSFYAEVDGKRTSLELFEKEFPRESRQDAEKKREKLATQMANATKEPFEKIFDDARETI